MVSYFSSGLLLRLEYGPPLGRVAYITPSLSVCLCTCLSASLSRFHHKLENNIQTYRRGYARQ